MKFIRETVWLALLLTASAWATSPNQRQIDNIQNLSGGSVLSVPSTGSTLVTDTATQTLQDKTLDGSSLITTNVKLEDTTDSTKQLAFSLSGNTTGKTLTFSFAQSLSETLSFPNVGSGDTVATLLATQTFGSGSTWNGATVGSAYGGTGSASPTAHTVPIAEGSSAYNFISGTTGQVLTWNASGDPSFQTASGGGTWTQEDVTGCNGTATSFTLANTPTASAIVQLHLDGLILRQGSGKDYTISGSSITLATACATGQQLYAIYAH
jgi:hypothetical protein